MTHISVFDDIILYLNLNVFVFTTYMWICCLWTVDIVLSRYGVWSHGVWKIQGIPGPPPLPLLGNSLDILKKVQNDPLLPN